MTSRAWLRGMPCTLEPSSPAFAATTPRGPGWRLSGPRPRLRTPAGRPSAADLGPQPKVKVVPLPTARYAERVHFVHLRNVTKQGDGRRSFVESDHLDGDVDMYRVMSIMCRERARRAAAGWADPELPFRPDHGHQMLDDLTAAKKTNPGYTAIGRLRGLAELRGLMEGIVRASADVK